MHRLRSARFLTRLLLLWFVGAFGVAVSSPWVAPQTLQLVCAANGALKLLPLDDPGAVDGAEPTALAGAAHSLDCPLCISPGLPPVPAPWLPRLASPLAYRLQSIPAARMALLTAAPLPPRGPPTLA
ncbi:hypothetical protein PSQ40_01270 [Curvibacter sp. HBC61]|uniref:DUF2946 domain-containing protein n=1 Tax=Curvibacter cyanobacteriorum TaxID=3026422 RepID=A0ABT5MT34_9BURK|nr:hypothetical protein [Curvibacter sp. HBC61]MDD0837190.1 hypothetical protein [Curvibacter sp. HBC61]